MHTHVHTSVSWPRKYYHQCKLQVMNTISLCINFLQENHQHKLQVMNTISLCINFLQENHQQCKLQRVKTILVTMVGAGCSNQLHVAQGQGLVRECALVQAIIALLWVREEHNVL